MKNIFITLLLITIVITACANTTTDSNNYREVDLYTAKYDGCTYVSRSSSYSSFTHHAACKNIKHTN